MNCHTWLHCLLRMLIIARNNPHLPPGAKLHIAWLIEQEATKPGEQLARETRNDG